MESVPEYTSDAFIPLLGGEKQIQNRLKWGSRSNDERWTNTDIKKQGASNEIHKVPANIPWKKSHYSIGIVGLHEEIKDFYDVMRPTEQEREIRLRAVEHITKTVHSLWPLAKVEVFGSFRTGLYLPSSDIDMVVFGEWKNLPLSTLSQALIRNGINSSDLSIIPNATVPIIRLLHTPTKIRIDISFNMENGIKSAQLVKSLMKQYPPLSKLLLVLKQFLVQRSLNEVYNGGMSSYCLTLLLISFLQGYHKPNSLPSTNLATLLIEFFELYGINFNYSNVSIYIQDGGGYLPKFRKGQLLSVEDPLMKGNDVAKGTYLINQLRMAFDNAFHTLHKAVTDSINMQKPFRSYLSLIIKIDDDVLKYRQWIAENYTAIMRSLSFAGKPFLQQDATETSNNRKATKRKKLGEEAENLNVKN